MSFSVHTETKVIRTRYIVGFYEGSTAKSMAEDLERMPPEAKLIEVQEPRDKTTGDFQRGQYTLIFECEKPIEEAVDGLPG